MRKCYFCGREGYAPDVRGTKSAAVTIGNYRMNADVDLTICEKCADEVMRKALDVLIGALAEGRSDPR